MSITVPCELCCGSGERKLSVQQAEIVAAIRAGGRSRDGWCTSNMVAERLTGESTVRSALTMNLTRLVALGVLERRVMAGRRYIWRVSNKVLQQAA